LNEDDSKAISGEILNQISDFVPLPCKKFWDGWMKKSRSVNVSGRTSGITLVRPERAKVR